MRWTTPVAFLLSEAHVLVAFCPPRRAPVAHHDWHQRWETNHQNNGVLRVASESSPNTESLSKKSFSQATSTGGVDFRLGQRSLDHLRCIEGNFGTYKPPPMTEARLKAIAFGIAGMGLSVLITYMLLNLDDAFSVIGSQLGFLLGYVAGGGLKLNESEKAKNGGTEVKFVFDRPERLTRVVEDVRRTAENVSNEGIASFSVINDSGNLHPDTMRLVEATHSSEWISYTENVTAKCRKYGAPRLLDPRYRTTMVDGDSFDAALSAVSEWLRAVDSVLDEKRSEGFSRVPFCLTRPPSHHATPTHGSGGCILCSVGIAAKYAVEVLKERNGNGEHGAIVSILDIDAHHGNGVAEVVQNDPCIRYCSIHEQRRSGSGVPSDDPNTTRGPEPEDQGPLGNILNVVIASGATWEDGYRSGLVNKAVPFLMGDTAKKPPDILLVAAGFDALDADFSSVLRLKPSDYEKLGEILKQNFGSQVIFGLEGGYAWEDGQLSDAILAMAKPWL